MLSLLPRRPPKLVRPLGCSRSSSRKVLTSPHAVGVRLSKLNRDSAALNAARPWKLCCCRLAALSPGLLSSSGMLPAAREPVVPPLLPTSPCVLKSYQASNFTKPPTRSEVLVPGIRNELGKLPEPGAVCAWARPGAPSRNGNAASAPVKAVKPRRLVMFKTPCRHRGMLMPPLPQTGKSNATYHGGGDFRLIFPVCCELCGFLWQQNHSLFPTPFHHTCPLEACDLTNRGTRASTTTAGSRRLSPLPTLPLKGGGAIMCLPPVTQIPLPP